MLLVGPDPPEVLIDFEGWGKQCREIFVPFFTESILHVQVLEKGRIIEATIQIPSFAHPYRVPFEFCWPHPSATMGARSLPVVYTFTDPTT